MPGTHEEKVPENVIKLRRWFSRPHVVDPRLSFDGSKVTIKFTAKMDRWSLRYFEVNDNIAITNYETQVRNDDNIPMRII